MSNPLVVYTTSLPQPARPRTQQEYILRTLYTLRIPCDVVDVSLDEEGKRTWRRKGRTDGKLPGFLVDGEFVGTIEDFEYAVEDGRLRDFLGLDNVPTPLPIPPPAPTPKPKPAPAPVVVPSPPPPAATDPSSSTEPEPSDGATLSLSTSTSSETKEADRSAAAKEDDELLESVGEDELEKLLREMEAEGM